VLTLGTCRKALWNYASSVPYSTASMADVASFDSKLAQVVERFFTVGTWKSMWYRLTLSVYDNTLTIPRGFDTCRYVEACAGPVPMYSQFHRFAGFGIAFDPVFTNPSGLKLIDENAQTFRIPIGTYRLRAVATEAADPGMSFTGGFDADGNEIFATENLVLVNGSSNATTIYTGLPYIKKVPTANSVLLYSVDTTSTIATLIASYAPGETIPEYRQYAGGCITSTTDDPPTVNAICKIAFVPAITANDLVIPGLIGALKLGLMSIQFEDKVDPTNADTYMNRAIALLDSELKELDMGEQPAFFVSPNFGAGSVFNVR